MVVAQSHSVGPHCVDAPAHPNVRSLLKLVPGNLLSVWDNQTVTVLGAFMATWSGARQTFGDGVPQAGSTFDESARLRQLADGLEAADPGSRWTGASADAYAKVNTEHRRVIGALADLDQRLAAHVDQSAQIVTSGRTELDAVRQWVADAAQSVPPGRAGEQMMLSIVQAGIGRVSEIMTRSNGDLNEVAGQISTLREEYQLLGDQKFGPKQAPPEVPPDEPSTDVKLLDILEKYQVSADPDGEITVDLPGMDPQTVTVSEAKLLARLGPLDAYEVYQIKEEARAEANLRFPSDGDEHDNHNDAFRHAYANALLTEKFGEEWTQAYTTAHERGPDNPAVVEAMDLYNNEIGRGIATDNPGADSDELAAKVEQAVKGGDMVVVDKDGNLGWSDQVPADGTGSAGDSQPIPGTDPKPLPYP